MGKSPNKNSVSSLKIGRVDVIRDKLNRAKIVNLFKRILAFREIALLLVILVVWLVLSNLTSSFQTIPNLRAVFLGLSLDAIIAVGMTILLIAGGFDLSVGSVLALGGISSALLVSYGVHPVFSAIGGLACGALVGFTNGIVVTKIGVNPLITTLGMMGIARGAAMVLTGGWGVSSLPDNFNVIGQKVLLGLQSPIWVMFGLVIVMDFLLRKSRLLRQTFYVGGNEKAARLSGINVAGIRLMAYVFTGFLAALSGLLLTARIGAATVTAGIGVELRVIAAVIIGGATLAGGEGSILGSLLAVLLLALVNNAFNLLGVSIYWQSIVQGIILIVAVTTDVLAKKIKLHRRLI